MKLLLALVVAYAASQVAYDRAYQHSAFLYRSPTIEVCHFKSVLTYGLTLTLQGFFEKGDCNIKKNTSL